MDRRAGFTIFYSYSTHTPTCNSIDSHVVHSTIMWGNLDTKYVVICIE